MEVALDRLTRILGFVSALAVESGRIVMELHRALSDIDPARWHAGAAEVTRQRLASLRGRLVALRAQRWPAAAASDVSLAELEGPLAELEARLAELPAREATMASARARWMAFKRSLEPLYEALERALRDFEVHVPSLRPTNYARNAVHISAAVLCIGILAAVPEPWWAIVIAGVACVLAWAMEISRRRSQRINEAILRVLSPIAHPHEVRRVNSATWYTTALAIMALGQAPLPAAVALAVLGAGDPTAALVGRRWGRIRIRHGRTLEGTLAFVLASTAGGFVAAALFAPSLSVAAWAGLAIVGAIAGALAELLSLRIDDNLSIPLAAFAAVGTAWLFL